MHVSLGGSCYQVGLQLVLHVTMSCQWCTRQDVPYKAVLYTPLEISCFCILLSVCTCACVRERDGLPM